MKNKQKSTEIFNAFVSHEIKSFLASAKAYAQLIEYALKKENTPKAEEQAQKLNQQLDKISDAFSIALDAHRITRDSLQLLVEKVTLQDLLNQLEQRHMLFGKGQSTPVADISLILDLNYTLRTFTSLVNFAKNHTNSPLKLSAITTKTSCVFSILYTGDTKIVTDGQKTFEPFFNAQTNKGSDLGLVFYVAKYIFESQKGSITLHKNNKKTIILRCALPLAKNSKK